MLLIKKVLSQLKLETKDLFSREEYIEQMMITSMVQTEIIVEKKQIKN